MTWSAKLLNSVLSEFSYASTNCWFVILSEPVYIFCNFKSFRTVETRKTWTDKHVINTIMTDTGKRYAICDCSAYNGNARPEDLWSKLKQLPRSPDQQWPQLSQGPFSSPAFYYLVLARMWQLGPSPCPKRKRGKILFTLCKLQRLWNQPDKSQFEEIKKRSFLIENRKRTVNCRFFDRISTDSEALYKSSIKTLPWC